MNIWTQKSQFKCIFLQNIFTMLPNVDVVYTYMVFVFSA